MPCSAFEIDTECCECSTDSTIVAKDNGAKSMYRFSNLQRTKMCKVRVDGCLINDHNVKKCDYLILDCSNRTAYFIELKGSDLMHAINQINTSLDILLPRLTEFTIINARIVLTRVNVPKAISGPAINKLQKRLKLLGGSFKKGTTPLSE